MISIGEVRKGIVVKVDGDLYVVKDFLHVKPGRGYAYVRTKLKSLKDGKVIEKTFRGSEQIEDVEVQRKVAQYLYSDGDRYVFMDLDTYEQYEVNYDMLGDDVYFLKEGMEVDAVFYEDDVIAIELPNFVILEVVETVPGVKGDTVSGSSKPAVLETGAKIQVPLFIKEGDKIKIDTRKKEYVERV